MKVLVTGATGFVGGHLCELLKQRGHAVYALARNKEKFERAKLPCHLILGGLQSEQPHGWVDELPEGLDTVVHSAGRVHSFDPKAFERTNFLATKRLILDLKARYPHLRFIFISSQAAAGPSKHKLDESCPLRPASQYGLSKKLAEECLQREAPPSWEKIIIRPPVVLGPRDAAFVPFFQMVRRGLAIVPGLNGGQREYSFVCVFDLVETIAKALEKREVKGETFFSCYPESMTLIQLIGEIQAAMAKKALVVPIPMPLVSTMAWISYGLHRALGWDGPLTPDKLRDLRPDAWCISAAKSERMLGMHYQWNLARTVEATLKDYLERNIL